MTSESLQLKDILYEIRRQLKAPKKILSGQDFLEVYAKYIAIESRV